MKKQTFYALIFNALNEDVIVEQFKAKGRAEAFEICEENSHNLDNFFVLR